MLDFSNYSDPGAYIGEVLVPGTVSSSSNPLTVCLVGVGSRTKKSLNEQMMRGLVSDESIAVSGARIASFTRPSTRQSSQTVVNKDGVAIDSLTDWAFMPATMTGATDGTFNLATNNSIGISLDGRAQLTIKITADAAVDSATANDGNVTVVLNTGTGYVAAAATAIKVASAINLALITHPSYGAAYGAVAVDSGAKVKLTSPTAGSSSEIKLYPAFVLSATVAVFGSVTIAPSSILLAVSAYNVSSTYTASYVATNLTTDALEYNTASTILRTGNYAGVSSYKLGIDYALSNGALNWGASTPAVFTSIAAHATYVLTTNDTITLSIDAKDPITIDLTGMADHPFGYVDAVAPAAASGAEVINNINAVLAGSVTYGPEYRGVATHVGSVIILTSPHTGGLSYVEVASPATLDAVQAVFGLTSTMVPFSARGAGQQPVSGATYFTGYEYTRPSTDFLVPKRFFSPDALYAEIGGLTTSNKLAVAGSICFANKAPSVMVVQVDDVTSSGSATVSEMIAAIAIAGTTSVATEIVPLDTRQEVAAAVVEHVANQCGPATKHYRRAYLGTARDTIVGDKDTAGSIVYMSTRTLSVPADSTARGRVMLLAPPNVSATMLLENGTSATIGLDGSFVAAAVAALQTSFVSASDVLLRKSITGFDFDSFQTYLPEERHILAKNGAIVVTANAGRLQMLDALTTEAGGGNAITFAEPSSSVQKDSVTLFVAQQIDDNLVGVVPNDIDDFIYAIKRIIAVAIGAKMASGDIGPYKDSSGRTRDIDLATDVQVFQVRSDPTKFYFRYYFNERLPAKRFMGEYSVNNPFF